MNTLSASLLSLVLAVAIFTLPFAASAEEQSWRQRVPSVQESGSTSDDVKEEVRFGREVAARMIGRYGLYQNDQLTRYVTLVGLTLGSNTNRPELAYRFAVLNTSDINAYAAPGGYIFVTRGAIEKMQDEAELAGVLAHEMIHVNERHVVRELGIRATEDSPASGLARMIGGGSETARIAFSQAVDKAVDILFKTGYKREDEIQADKGAVMICAITGYDPDGLARYFERISAARGKATEVLDTTHPLYDSRVALIRETMAKDGIVPGSYRTQKERFAAAMRSVR